MPYIPKEERECFDILIKQLECELLIHGFVGRLNYFLFKLAKRKINNYATAQQFIGELEACKLEIYRKIIAPYEDKKIEENGDVF